jgi:hypothetical protein
MFLPLLLLLNAAGLARFTFWLIRQIRACRSATTARRMMAQKLRASVRSQNAHRTIAALHEGRKIEVPTLESAMASRAELCARIEGIRLRVLARTAASGEAGRRFHTPARTLCDVPGIIVQPILGN